MIRGLLGIVLILGAIHVGYMFSSPVIKNSMLEAKMKDIANNPGLRGERELRRDVMAFVNEKNIPLPTTQVQIILKDEHVGIGAHYKTRVEFLFFTKDYEFYPASSAAAVMKPRAQRKARKAA